MINSALVIGFGSIGRRHYEILVDILGRDKVTVLSRQDDLPKKALRKLEEIPKKTDYVVIANETHKHLEYLNFIVENTDVKKVLVEKPLFDDVYAFDPKEKSIFVGYNLRFHPLINTLRDLLKGQIINAVYCSCHSYLPAWRKERHFSESYSAREHGGGVILDLSHEIDLLLWLFGNIEIDFTKVGNFSTLKIDSEDSMFLSGHIDNGSPIELSLSYFSTIERRQIHVVTEESTYLVDLVNNIIYSRDKNLSISEHSLDSFDMNKTYIEQHLSIINDKSDSTAKLQDGLKVNNFIQLIKSWSG